MAMRSALDELYNDLMGFYPAKAGTAYEEISSAVLGIVMSQDVKTNRFIKGFSKTTYQIDGLLDDSTMVEAKDYTIRKKKVGRGDLQKMQGALTDLPRFDKGVFASGSGYTKPALKYADGSVENPMQKPIIPAEIRLSTDDDKKGRIETIVVNIVICEQDYDKASYSLVFGDDAECNKFKSYLQHNASPSQGIRIHELYDATGALFTTIENLTREDQYKYDETLKCYRGIWNIDGYIKCGNEMFHISGINYNIPVVEHTESFMIEMQGEAKVLIKCDALGFDKLITDVQLKEAIKALHA